MLGGQQNKSKDAGCTATGLTGSSKVLQNKSKPKMVKPKKPEICVWKAVESKGRCKHQKEKSKPFLGDLPAKSKKQNNDASRLKHPKHSRSTPRQQFHDRNQQQNNFSNSMSLPSHRSPISMPCGSYYSMPCFYLSWYYNLCHFSLYICAQIMLPIGNRQLVNHHLPLMTVLMKKMVYTEKEIQDGQASLSYKKGWTIKQKFRFDTR